jgi:hypothetical protein
MTSMLRIDRFARDEGEIRRKGAFLGMRTSRVLSRCTAAASRFEEVLATEVLLLGSTIGYSRGFQGRRGG